MSTNSSSSSSKNSSCSTSFATEVDSDPFHFLNAPITLTNSDSSDTEDDQKFDNKNIFSTVNLKKLGVERVKELSELQEQIRNNPFMCVAFLAIKIRLVYSDTRKEYKELLKSFMPVMSHQVFGPDEIIYGYRNLKINFDILPSSFHTRITYTYDEIAAGQYKGQEPDNILEKLCSVWFPHNIASNDEFEKLKQAEKLDKIYGTCLNSFKVHRDNTEVEIFIQKCTAEEPGFLEFHMRYQGLIVFYIDAASVIDDQDLNWQFFYVYLGVKQENASMGYVPIGFCTVYLFQSTRRARIAQQFILPTFQGRGIGTKLLATIYKYYHEVDSIDYITVETPCEEFTNMRDKLDLRLISKHEAFRRSNILSSFCLTPVMEKATKTICKMSYQQTRRIFKILLCYYTKSHMPDYKRFIQYLKKEIYVDYKKKLKKLKDRPSQKEKALRLMEILCDDFMINARIDRDYKRFVNDIQPQLEYLTKLIS